MPNMLVTGAASGLGRAIVESFARNSGDESTLFALDVQEFPSNSLDTDTAQSLKIIYRSIDVTDEVAVKAFARELDDQDIALHLVVHSAGVRGLVSHVAINTPEDVAKAETVDTMDTATIKRTFEINTVGFFVLARALLPSLRRAAALGAAVAEEEQTRSRGVLMGSPPKVVVMGSRMGSIGHNVSAGGGYAYRASKASLNAVVRSFSIDIPDVVWTVVHPGRVESGLVSVKEDGAISVDEALKDLMPLIARLKKNDSGRFVDRFGEDVPW